VGDVDDVVFSRWCSLAISVRICTRSLASRLESGSSNRKTLRLAHDGAAHGDALALAAGELARLAVEQRLEAEDLGARAFTRSAISALGTRAASAPKAMFSRTVMCG
jgi:hypothetical protein